LVEERIKCGTEFNVGGSISLAVVYLVLT